VTAGGSEETAEWRPIVAKVDPYHSKAPNDRKVYHDHNDCTEGNNIESYNKVSGTGGYPRCEHCQRLG
jgi:hypothetical protein